MLYECIYVQISRASIVTSDQNKSISYQTPRTEWEEKVKYRWLPCVTRFVFPFDVWFNDRILSLEK